MTDRIPMTPEGYEKLKEELDRLIKIERPAIIKAIAEARAHGDLSENAEYHAAREKQSFIEGRIQELQAKLARAYVIDPSKINQNKVAFGAKVRVIDIDTDEEKEFHLVGPDEADVKNGKISITSPVGRALIGKEVGEQVTIKAPAKTFNYEIISISFE
ncbi:transcription elongation factor GreA [Thermodesulfovibrio yellowstonii]|uniref:Transcription elongation factor GreA n=1 Tax=Thermodesulfovibrio yellowstonii TaxID=28262 RepID=A0A9W6LKX5_9BACT|nr:transcription elongation factor GreA [Thermodesulfovibrio yellowstonii]MDI6864363.1 transcription elongation factor GreA [Thermodesulfovibrio yellowstonii]GLI54094.1 transcription elongation factor GreA [Thermodesulfovibrio islandicus]